MKRCPQCNRIENNQALKYCRVDGATLVSESSSLGGEAGSAQPGSDASEVHTSILPHRTDANINRGTAPTTVLPAKQAASTTGQLVKPKRRKALIVVSLASVVVITLTIGDSFFFTRNRTATIESIAVLPFENRSGSQRKLLVSGSH